ncbi:MAG: O-antigen ligase family protein [Patescibacteria group bacterium]
MQQRLTAHSIFLHWQTPVLLTIFFAIRLLSFFIASHPIIQAALVFVLLMILGIAYFKNPHWAFYLVIGELFLGGAGHYLEFINLSVRTLVIATFLVLWTLHTINDERLGRNIRINRKLNIALLIFYFLLIASAVNGIRHDHALTNIIQDLMPFLYLPLIFPAYQLLAKQETQEYFVRLVIVFLIGSAIFSVFTFVLFGSGIAELQGPFYQWFRDVSMGKITAMGNNFFRVVLPEHLLITPIILVISSLLMRNEKHHKMWRLLLFLAAAILVLNFSRGYFLALFAGLLILKYKHQWRRWFIISATTIGLVVLIFTSFAIFASGGKTFGWELLGVRVVSLTAPQIEVSAATRMMVLPAILEIIKDNPIAGVGLGATVTFMNTLTYEIITTRHFDWGYLEMLAELGVFGALALLSLYLFTAVKLNKKINHASDWHDFYVGLLASTFAMLVINITSPALFHVFGIIFLVLAIAIAAKPIDIFERLITLLYRIFNRIKKGGKELLVHR